uniref:Uncharacterized protein n=1 Tax=Arundo donax TaxID=35708 RepID=A0A0A9BAH0_ARUDO
MATTLVSTPGTLR